MLTKKWISLLLAAVMLLTLAACSKPDEKQETTAPTESVPATKATQPETKPAPTETQPAPTELAIPFTEGFWVRPEDFQAPGSLPSEVLTLAESGSWKDYDLFGNPRQPRGYSFENGILTLESQVGDISFRFEEGKLFSADTGTLEYVQVHRPPEFATDEEYDFNGRWYFAGSQFSNLFYEISDYTYQKISLIDGEPTIEDEGNLILCTENFVFGDYIVPEMNVLKSEDGELILIPNGENMMFFEDNGESYDLYINSVTADTELYPIFQKMTEFMNGELIARKDDGTVWQLQFLPYCFSVMVYTENSNGVLELRGDPLFGQWSFADESSFVLVYPDGTAETVLLMEDSPLYLEKFQTGFELS